MKKLCILLPTYGREECVAYFLEQTLEECRYYSIDVYVCDSSNTDENKELVNRYHNKGYKNIYFMQGHESIEYKNGFVAEGIQNYSNPDYKVFVAQSELADKYEYIWLCGDNCVLKLDQTMEDVMKYTEQCVDIIHFSNGREMPFGDRKIYTDAQEFYLNDAWHMTAYGASIVSSRVIKKINTDNVLDKYINSGFLYVMSVYEFCAANSFTAVHCQRNFHKNNPYRELSGWIASGNALAVFGQNWVEVNRKLPDIYNNIKNNVIMSFSINTGLFSYKRCFELRKNNNITLQKIMKYGEYIPLITKTKILWFLLVAICPKFVSGWMFSMFVHKK